LSSEEIVIYGIFWGLFSYRGSEEEGDKTAVYDAGFQICSKFTLKLRPMEIFFHLTFLCLREVTLTCKGDNELPYSGESSL